MDFVGQKVRSRPLEDDDVVDALNREVIPVVNLLRDHLNQGVPQIGGTYTSTNPNGANSGQSSANQPTSPTTSTPTSSTGSSSSLDSKTLIVTGTQKLETHITNTDLTLKFKRDAVLQVTGDYGIACLCDMSEGGVIQPASGKRPYLTREPLAPPDAVIFDRGAGGEVLAQWTTNAYANWWSGTEMGERFSAMVNSIDRADSTNRPRRYHVVGKHTFTTSMMATRIRGVAEFYFTGSRLVCSDTTTALVALDFTGSVDCTIVDLHLIGDSTNIPWIPIQLARNNQALSAGGVPIVSGRHVIINPRIEGAWGLGFVNSGSEVMRMYGGIIANSATHALKSGQTRRHCALFTHSTTANALGWDGGLTSSDPLCSPGNGTDPTNPTTSVTASVIGTTFFAATTSTNVTCPLYIFCWSSFRGHDIYTTSADESGIVIDSRDFGINDIYIDGLQIHGNGTTNPQYSVRTMGNSGNNIIHCHIQATSLGHKSYTIGGAAFSFGRETGGDTCGVNYGYFEWAETGGIVSTSTSLQQECQFINWGAGQLGTMQFGSQFTGYAKGGLKSLFDFSQCVSRLNAVLDVSPSGVGSVRQRWHITNDQEVLLWTDDKVVAYTTSPWAATPKLKTGNSTIYTSDGTFIPDGITNLFGRSEPPQSASMVLKTAANQEVLLGRFGKLPTNIVINGRRFEFESWGVTRTETPVLDTGVTDPDGGQRARKIEVSSSGSGNTTHLIATAITVSNGTKYLQRIWFKAGTDGGSAQHNHAELLANGTAIKLVVSMADGSFTWTGTPSRRPSVFGRGDGWYCAELPWTEDGTTTQMVIRMHNGTTDSFTSDDASTIYVYGAEVLADLGSRGLTDVEIDGNAAIQQSKLQAPYLKGNTLTIATGAVTIMTGCRRHALDTEAAAATDDLDTINGGSAGQDLILSAADSARTVVAKDGTGNMKLAGDFSMDNAEDRLHLHTDDGSTWIELNRSDNGA
jgi:hypothetical protein